ncbi:hypothetical protein CSOJ01_10766 [Colletotrichum sojae]|uniref:Uncharacterized protein n=1 Tax=Colletotrichum sojae TaxID=2175907 RepID=A0A8H6IZI4_9PEZI|nr:hypothetical protein CSOJ01_10766 [Colletotrichum sojae]
MVLQKWTFSARGRGERAAATVIIAYASPGFRAPRLGSGWKRHISSTPSRENRRAHPRIASLRLRLQVPRAPGRYPATFKTTLKALLCIRGGQYVVEYMRNQSAQLLRFASVYPA